MLEARDLIDLDEASALLRSLALVSIRFGLG